MQCIKNVLWSTTKSKAITCITSGVLTVCVAGGAAVCLFPEETHAEAPSIVETVSSKEKINETDLAGIITGLDDKYILQESTGIDFLNGIQANNEIIEHIDVDTSKVDLSKAGEYEVTYTVAVNEDKLKEHLSNDNIVKQTGESKTSKKSSVQKLSFTKMVRVVTQEEAQQLADKGIAVLSSNNEVIAKTDGTAVPIPETPVENPTSQTPVIKTDTKPASTSNNTDSTESHAHTWNPVYKTVVVKEAYDETVIVTPARDEPVYETKFVCKRCGHAADTDMLALDHSVWCEIGYTKQQVQTGMKHYDAVTKIVNHPAETKEVIDHYTCSCGATK